MLLHEKFLQFDWLKAVVFRINLKNRHVKIRKLLRVVVQTNNGDFKIQQTRRQRERRLKSEFAFLQSL